MPDRVRRVVVIDAGRRREPPLRRGADAMSARACLQVALAILVAVLALGCETSRGVVVQLTSNMTPGREIDTARVELTPPTGAPRSIDVSLSAGRALGRPIRLGAFDGLAEGRYAISVTLLLHGTVVQTRRVVRDVSRVVVVTVLMTRECNGVMCPGTGDPAALECLGGRCVSPECDEEHPELCAMPECVADEDCTGGAIACAPESCSASGACYARADDGLCPAGSTCDGERGCVVVGADAGMDASMARDTGTDVGVDAAGCRAGEHMLGGRCVPLVEQLDFDGDGYGDLVVGASGEMANEGAAYLYHGTSTGPMLAATFRRAATDEHVGLAVADAHDTDGDGLDDVLISAHTGAGGGHAYLLLGRATPTGLADVELGATAASEFGQFMAGLGDIDGDGLADVVLAEDGASRAHLFLGTSSGLPAGPDLTFAPPDLARIAALGDVDGDGNGDLAFGGAFGATEHVHLYLATAGSFGATPTRTIAPGTSGVSYGSLGAADVNGDGVNELIVGAAGSPAGGVVYVHHGQTGGPDFVSFDTIAAPAGTSQFGTQVAGLGDLDHDGYDDVAIASDVTTAAVVHLYRGSAGGLATARTSVITLPAMAGRSSISITAADLDGDGHAELIVGDSAREHVYAYSSPLAPSGTPTYDLTQTGATRFGSAITAR
jgi:hypothetical protein